MISESGLRNRPSTAAPQNAMTVLVAAMLLLSGAASLIYQVTWMRILGLSLGSTSASTSTVVSAFFLGLALGSYLTELITRKSGGNFRQYGLVELLIGGSGLIFLPLFLNIDALLAYAPGFGLYLLPKFLLATLLLIVPATAMGATFPIMASIIVRLASGISGCRPRPPRDAARTRRESW